MWITRSIMLLVLMVCIKSINAQDTIFVKTQKPLLVRVLEVSSTEVRYKNFYNPDGITRVLNYNEIDSITYENGKREQRFLAPKNQIKDPFFVIEGNHVSLRNKDLTHMEAFKIMLQKDPQKNSDELNNALLNVESKKNGQLGFIIVSPVCLVGGFYIAKRNYYGPNDLPKFRTILLSGLGLAAGCFITSQVYKAVKNKQIRKAANLYNDEL